MVGDSRKTGRTRNIRRESPYSSSFSENEHRRKRHRRKRDHFIIGRIEKVAQILWVCQESWRLKKNRKHRKHRKRTRSPSPSSSSENEYRWKKNCREIVHQIGRSKEVLPLIGVCENGENLKKNRKHKKRKKRNRSFSPSSSSEWERRRKCTAEMEAVPK